jgi:hypothetical protein
MYPSVHSRCTHLYPTVRRHTNLAEIRRRTYQTETILPLLIHQNVGTQHSFCMMKLICSCGMHIMSTQTSIIRS